jgi:hypothetical protein
MMKHCKGEFVRIAEKSALEALPFSSNQAERPYIVNYEMKRFAGMVTQIISVCHNYYRVSVDDGRWAWDDSMLDHYYRCEDPLDAEDAFAALMEGHTLYKKDGGVYRFTEEIKERFQNLYAYCLKRKRLMTQEEAQRWAADEASNGWMVSSAPPYVRWDFPLYFNYIGDIQTYRRAKLLPNSSGIDKETIQNLEVEE